MKMQSWSRWLVLVVLAGFLATGSAVSAQRIRPDSAGRTKVELGGRFPLEFEIPEGKNTVHGDVVVAPTDTVNHDLAVSGGSATIDGVVQGDVAVMGGTLVLNGLIDGDCVVIGGSGTIAGHVTGDLAVIGGAVTVHDSVGGDLVVLGGSATLDSAAVIGGNIATLAGSCERAAGATVGGRIEELKFGEVGRVLPGLVRIVEYGAQRPMLVRAVRFGVSLAWLIGTFLLVILAAVVVPRPTGRVTEAVEKRFFKSLLFGVIGELLIAPLFVILVITILGILVIPFAAIGVLLAFLVAMAAISIVLARRVAAGFGWSTRGELGLVALGMAVFYLLPLFGALLRLAGPPLSVVGTLLALIGALFIYAAVTVGLGGVILTRFGTRPVNGAYAATPPAPPTPPPASVPPRAPRM